MFRNFLPTVVVADPDMFYQQRIAISLQQGFRCILTGSLRETYWAILCERPALVILELNQPDGDGIALIQHLQADPALKGILIACVTQRATIRDKVRAFRAGADDYIVKPLSSSFFGQMLLLRRAGHMARGYAVAAR
ncbi:MAG TPA: response regulator [Ktedonobacterales bacterium]|jgi:DNA-binding response OmpR family regulator